MVTFPLHLQFWNEKAYRKVCGWIFPHNLDLELRSGPTTSEINLTTHPNTLQKVSEPNVPLPEAGITGTITGCLTTGTTSDPAANSSPRLRH